MAGFIEDNFKFIVGLGVTILATNQIVHNTVQAFNTEKLLEKLDSVNKNLEVLIEQNKKAAGVVQMPAKPTAFKFPIQPSEKPTAFNFDGSISKHACSELIATYLTQEGNPVLEIQFCDISQDLHFPQVLQVQ